jgi:formate/nitrite transporter FocA (FNT family)
MNNKLIEPDKRIEKWTVRPNFQSIVYYTGVSSTYSAKRGFVNTDTDTPHFGTKLVWASNGNLCNGNLMISCKYFFTVKNTR